ncbi:MAG TPA: hypothetical protein PKX56_02715 [Marmoricola sp.]|nr:hypothetical protein [Marmoricola sp.]
MATATATRTRKARTYRKAGDAPEKIQVDWANLIEQMLDPSVPAHLGSTYSKFKAGTDGRGYSFLNQFWLYLQGAKGPVAPFGTWKSFNRFPLKDTAKTVLTPVKGTGIRKDANGNPVIDPKTGKPVKYQFIIRFEPRRTAFDYADTKGEDIDFPSLAEDWDLDRALAALDITKVEYKLLDGNTQGYSTGRTYAINPVAAHPWKTLFHELAHIVLGHTDEAGIKEYQQHRGLMEFQAEATAYLLAHELDLTDWDASESRAYVRNWLGENEVSEKTVQAIFGAADKILRAGRTVETAKGEGEAA